MKINKIGLTQVSSTKIKHNEETANSKFNELFDEKKDNNKREELYQMMDKIKKHSEKLVESRNIEILVTYKKMIKEFVSQAVDFAFEIQERKGMSRIGRNKILRVISMIDESLVDITQSFLEDERNKIQMLSKIGELQGLMMNLFV